MTDKNRIDREKGDLFVSKERQWLSWRMEQGDKEPGGVSWIRFLGQEVEVNAYQVTQDPSAPDQTKEHPRPATLEEMTEFAAKALEEKPDNRLTHELYRHVSERLVIAAEALGMTVMKQTASPRDIQ